MTKFEKYLEEGMKMVDQGANYSATIKGEGWELDETSVYQNVELTVVPSTGKEGLPDPKEFALALVQDVTRRVEDQFSGLHGRCIWIGPQIDPRGLKSVKTGSALKLTFRITLPMERMNRFVDDTLRYEAENTVRRLMTPKRGSGNKEPSY